MCFPTWETHIPTDMCSPTWETHIPSDMGSLTWETHMPSDMCSCTWETYIPGDMCSPTRETHFPTDICFPTWETHIPSDATLLASNSQHCWMLHVDPFSHTVTCCCVLLGVVVQSLKPVKRMQTDSTCWLNNVGTLFRLLAPS